MGFLVGSGGKSLLVLSLGGTCLLTRFFNLFIQLGHGVWIYAARANARLSGLRLAFNLVFNLHGELHGFKPRVVVIKGHGNNIFIGL